MNAFRQTARIRLAADRYLTTKLYFIILMVAVHELENIHYVEKGKTYSVRKRHFKGVVKSSSPQI
jgi:hypothetical protein